MTNLDSILKSRHYFANKVPSGQGYGFSSGHGCESFPWYGCESWTVKKAEVYTHTHTHTHTHT